MELLILQPSTTKVITPEPSSTIAHKQGVEVIVAFPGVSAHAPHTAFDVGHFTYDKTLDQSTCPADEHLTTNGRWYNKASGKTINPVKHYKTKACLTCRLFEQCTKNKKRKAHRTL